MIPLARRVATAKKAASVRKRVKEARQAPERALHIAVAQYLTVALQPPHWFSTFPAGGGGKARGGQLKAMGLKAGVPDILIINGHTGRAHWIELKAPQGHPSEAQWEMIIALGEANCSVIICRSLAEVQAGLTQWGFKINAKVAA